MDRFKLYFFNESYFNFKGKNLVLKYFNSVYYWYIKCTNISDSLSECGFFRDYLKLVYKYNIDKFLFEKNK